MIAAAHAQVEEALCTADSRTAKALVVDACRRLVGDGRPESELEWLLARLLSIWDNPERRARVIAEVNELLAIHRPQLARLDLEERR